MTAKPKPVHYMSFFQLGQHCARTACRIVVLAVVKTTNDATQVTCPECLHLMASDVPPVHYLPVPASVQAQCDWARVACGVYLARVDNAWSDNALTPATVSNEAEQITCPDCIEHLASDVYASLTGTAHEQAH